MSARCGKINGIPLAVMACSRVLSSRMEAQEISLGARC
jgi:hypothetical protein